jgi:hypothetical protein
MTNPADATRPGCSFCGNGRLKPGPEYQRLAVTLGHKDGGMTEIKAQCPVCGKDVVVEFPLPSQQPDVAKPISTARMSIFLTAFLKASSLIGPLAAPATIYGHEITSVNPRGCHHLCIQGYDTVLHLAPAQEFHITVWQKEDQRP